jgi:ABC-type protease/lipase transport system fused ATPase/permease subunit
VLILFEVMKVGATKGKVGRSNLSAISSYAVLDLALPSAEAVVGMGMLPSVLRSWSALHEDTVSAEVDARNRTASLESLAAGTQILFQAAIISVAAIQYLRGEVPAGFVFVASILFQFAMRPAHRIIAVWTDYVPVRQGLLRIEDVLRSVPARRAKIELPRPRGVLTVKGVAFFPPGSNKPVLRNLNFGIEAGTSLGVVGLMGAGKTTLARLMVGCLRPSAGTVRLDGSDIWEWMQSGAMRHVGYLPQAIGLLPATVAENISRFGDFDEPSVVAAARLAGAHDLILRLPRGYDTPIGPGGHPISGGQRQLIGLARAVIGNPSLVVLDEPNSNLDGPGEDALRSCVQALEAAGTTLVLISHRSDLVRQMKRAVLLKEGEVVGFGETEEVYRKLGRRPTVVKVTHVAQ